MKKILIKVYLGINLIIMFSCSKYSSYTIKGNSSNEKVFLTNENFITYENLDTSGFYDYEFLHKNDSSYLDSIRQVITKFSNNGIAYNHSIVEVNGESYYLVEGDLLLNELEYSRYKKHLNDTNKENGSYLVSPIVGESINGEPVRQPPNKVIKYAVIRHSFTESEYQLVKENMKKATVDWQNTCNVKFFHDKSKDNNIMQRPPQDLTFIVKGVNVHGFIAKAFAPYDPIEKRILLINSSYFITRYNQVGILRHEIGHILGFKHEQTRKEAPLDCPEDEDDIGDGRRGIIVKTYYTDYDKLSVMHYPCGDSRFTEFKISERDRIGAQALYGKPR